MKEKVKYSSSKHISSGGSGSRNFNMYSKYQERKDKGIVGEELEQWKNMLRIENQYKKYGILPSLENYWCYDSYKDMYIDIFDRYFFNDSRHYKLNIAQNMINNSNELSFTMKKNINKFLRAVELVGMGKIDNYFIDKKITKK